MVADILREGPIRLSPAARILDLHPATLLRAGQAGKLEIVKIGGRWYTSRPALERWAQKPATPEVPSAPSPSPARRERMRRRLDAVGI